MRTEKQYNFNNCIFTVAFDHLVIRIQSSPALREYLSKDIEARSIHLVTNIKNDYRNLFDKELQIDNDSLMVEIWGHLYASYLAKGIKNLIELKLVENVVDFVITRSDTIDCGEAEIDQNRRLWDILANFKSLLLTFLPERLK